MEHKKLGDIATYVNGYAFKPEDRGTKGLPIIRIQDLTGNSYDLGFYNGEYPKKIELNNGDILISWSASLGVYEWNRGKALLNQHIFKAYKTHDDVLAGTGKIGKVGRVKIFFRGMRLIGMKNIFTDFFKAYPFQIAMIVWHQIDRR